MKGLRIKRVTCLLKLYDSSCWSLLEYSSPRGHGELSVRDWVVKSRVSMKTLQTQQASTEYSIHRELFARATESSRYHPEGWQVDLFLLNCSWLFSASLHFRDAPLAISLLAVWVLKPHSRSGESKEAGSLWDTHTHTLSFPSHTCAETHTSSLLWLEQCVRWTCQQ